MTAAFLKVNGQLEFNDLDAYAFLIGPYKSGRLRFAELEGWLRQHAVRSDPAT